MHKGHFVFTVFIDELINGSKVSKCLRFDYNDLLINCAYRLFIFFKIIQQKKRCENTKFSFKAPRKDFNPTRETSEM